MRLTDRIGGRPRIEYIAVAVIIALAAWLRLSHLDLIEYKFDEATAIDLTLPLVEGEAWPRVGLVSSVGIRNPPMLMYVLAAPLSVSVDPLVVTAFVGLLSTLAVLGSYLVFRPRFGAFVGLTTAALFATAPWAVLTGRKIWAQDLLPIFSLALLACLFAILERPKTKLAVVVPVLACWQWQLHFSALTLLPIVALVVLYAWRRVWWTGIALGSVLALLMAAPYAHYQLTEGARDAGQLRALASNSAKSITLDLRPLSYMAQLTGATGWEYVTGPSDRVFRNFRPSIRRAATVASIACWGLLVAGFVMLAARALRRAIVQRTRLDLDDERRMVLLLWAGGICLAFTAARLDAVYPHYFVLVYPVSFAIVALALDACRSVVAPSWARAATIAVTVFVAATCAAYAAFDVSFFDFLSRRGGTGGDYGVIYRYKDAVARFALANHLELGEAPEEVAQLVALRRKYPRPIEPAAQGLPPAHLLDVRDRLKLQALPGCPPERLLTFGPLVACLRP